MVKQFGAEVGQTNDPSYIGYSKEGDANTSMKKLFSGLANLVDLKSNFYEEQQKEKEAEVTQGIVDAPAVDPSEISGGEAQDTLYGGAATGKEVEADIQKVEIQGKKLTQAYAEGKISSSQYWMQMDAMVKQAKARYPGAAGRRIEAAVTAALGRRPASAAVEEQRDEYKSTLAAANEEDKKFNSFVDTNIKFLPPDYFQRQRENRPYTKLETRAYVQDQQVMDLKNQRRQTQMELAIKQGTLNEDEAMGAALDEVTGYTNRVLVGVADTQKNFTDLLKRAQQKGKDFSPQDQMALRQAFADLKLQVQQGIEKVLSNNWAGGESNYINTIRSPEKIKQIREAGMARIEQYEKYINDKDFGLLNSDINRSKALKDEANRKVLESSDQIRIFNAVKEMGGDTLLNEMLLSPEGQKMKSTAVKAFRDIKLGQRMAGESVSLQNDMQETKHLTADKKEIARLNYQLVKDSVATLTNPNTTVDIQSNTVRYMFGPKNSDFLSQLSPAQRTEIYTRMISPEVTKQMLALKESDAEAWNLYKTWAMDSFGGLFRDLGAAVQEGVTARPWIDVKWDSKSSQFVVSSTAQRPGKLAFSGIVPRVMESFFTVQTERSIAEFNRQIKALEPILKADNYEMGEELLGLLNSMGIDDMAPKQASFFAKLRAGLSKTYEDDNGGGTTTADGKKR